MENGEGNGSDRLSARTRVAEEVESSVTHQPDRLPTEDEEALAEQSADELERSGKSKSVADHEADMARRGVEERGEGRIE